MASEGRRTSHQNIKMRERPGISSGVLWEGPGVSSGVLFSIFWHSILAFYSGVLWEGLGVSSGVLLQVSSGILFWHVFWHSMNTGILFLVPSGILFWHSILAFLLAFYGISFLSADILAALSGVASLFFL